MNLDTLSSDSSEEEIRDSERSFQSLITLVNVYVALPVFTSVAGRPYAHFMEQNGGAHDVNR